MDISFWFFICSGLFLGWSLGSNHAVNVFGTAVTSRMLKFRTAAIIGGVFVTLGAFISGAGTTETLNNLGGINAIAGSFTVALAVGISITWMTKAKLPVSTSQAVIGAIIGWNIFTGTPTDISSLSKILISWVLSPIIAGLFGFILFQITKRTILKWKIHLLTLDKSTRIGLIIVGSLASYSLGANNIANVMGMFVSSSELADLSILNDIKISGVQQLFFLGGISIAIGMFTYGEKVMSTVGKDLYKISPITGLIVVLAEFLVLTLFTSKSLELFLISINLPSFPLVPLSTTQAFIGAVIGVGLAKDPLSINFKVFRRITLGWVIAPIFAGIIAYVSLFFVQNVFEQNVINPVNFQISNSVLEQLKNKNVDIRPIKELTGKRFDNKKVFRNELIKKGGYSNACLFSIFNYSVIDSFFIDSLKIKNIKNKDIPLSVNEINGLYLLHGKAFSHKHDFNKVISDSLKIYYLNDNSLRINEYNTKMNFIQNLFRIETKTK